MSDCLFCKIAAHESPAYILFEDDKAMAFLDIHPINPGHTLIIPKKHSDNFAAMSAEDTAAVMNVAQKVAPAILKAVGADSFNFTANNGRAAGQIIFHTHFHLMPRFAKDGYPMWKGPEGKPDFAAIAEKIRGSF